MKVMCNECFSVFDNKYITGPERGLDEACPYCGSIGVFENWESETENYKKYKHTMLSQISVTEMVSFDNGNESCLNKIIHDIVRELQTEKTCPRCGEKLYCSDLAEYDYICAKCDANFYECEV